MRIRNRPIITFFCACSFREIDRVQAAPALVSPPPPSSSRESRGADPLVGRAEFSRSHQLQPSKPSDEPHLDSAVCEHSPWETPVDCSSSIVIWRCVSINQLRHQESLPTQRYQARMLLHCLVQPECRVALLCCHWTIIENLPASLLDITANPA